MEESRTLVIEVQEEIQERLKDQFSRLRELDGRLGKLGSQVREYESIKAGIDKEFEEQQELAEGENPEDAVFDSIMVLTIKSQAIDRLIRKLQKRAPVVEKERDDLLLEICEKGEAVLREFQQKFQETVSAGEKDLSEKIHLYTEALSAGSLIFKYVPEMKGHGFTKYRLMFGGIRR